MISDQGPGQVLDSHEGSIISTKVNGCVKLDINTDHEVAGWDPISIPCMLNKAVKEAPDVTALAVKRQDQWIKWTYKEYLQVCIKIMNLHAKVRSVSNFCFVCYDFTNRALFQPHAIT